MWIVCQVDQSHEMSRPYGVRKDRWLGNMALQKKCQEQIMDLYMTLIDQRIRHSQSKRTSEWFLQTSVVRSGYFQWLSNSMINQNGDEYVDSFYEPKEAK